MKVIIDSFCLFLEMIYDVMYNCLIIIKVLYFLLDVVYDIKEWLVFYVEQFYDYVQLKCFKYVWNFFGKCEMFYCNYFYMQWEGLICNCVEGKFMVVMCCNIECIFRIILREKLMFGVQKNFN